MIWLDEIARNIYAVVKQYMGTIDAYVNAHQDGFSLVVIVAIIIAVVIWCWKMMTHEPDLY